ncbi:hypothetical protein FALBO_4620 [Fusarium albosuccineum]|uniref:C2H2-type domain-containing protein n=1 Tax=Fusarium albosuccineum TaxID=1237068 RepID=A0A8H4LI08_9HYPO|nr:hypothetical protein FALBO_4620 [Fusarium albosuccineum]
MNSPHIHDHDGPIAIARVSPRLRSDGLPALAGTKRAAEPPTQSSNASDENYPILPSSEDKNLSNSSSSDDSGSDSDHFEDPPQKYELPSDHRLQAQRPKLQLFSREEFENWRGGVKHTAPRDDRLPPRKRFKASDSREASTSADERQHASEKNEARSKGFFHLACPFYVSNPKKHQKCLLLDDLRSIKGVINHIVAHHSKPPYCPICWKAFNSVADRDSHILTEKCRQQDSLHIEGINLDQRAWLTERDRGDLDERARWHSIWSIVFPKSERPQSPYLDEVCRLAVSEVRDFWDANGQQCVLKFLDSSNLPGEDDGRVNDAFCKLALEDLLNGIMERLESAHPGSLGST